MTQSAPTIALCMIVKNEEQFIGACIDSVLPFVDEIVVVDTGSTDATVDLALERGARVEHFEWINDFAAARNFAIDAATSDWILMLDADEELSPDSGPFLRQATSRLPNGAFGYAVQIENHVGAQRTAHYMTRYFPKHPQLRFAGSIHEELKPVPGLEGTIVHLPQVRVIHHGYEPSLYAARNKDARNMRLLEQELETQPHDARLLYYVAQQHCAQRRYETAIPYFQRFMANKDQLRPAFTQEIYRMWLEALLALDRQAEVAEIASEAQAAGALSSYAREMLGQNHAAHGRLREALEELKASADPATPAGLWGRPTGTEWEIQLKISDVHWALGEHKRSLRVVDKLFDSVDPEKKYTVAIQIARKCGANSHYGPARRWAVRARKHAPEDFSVHFELLGFEMSLPSDDARIDEFAEIDKAVAAADWQAVYDLGRSLPLRGLAALARMIRITDQMTDMGAADAALDLLERALDAYPKEQLVYWKLARTLNALDRHLDAADALAVIESLEREAPALKAA